MSIDDLRDELDTHQDDIEQTDVENEPTDDLPDDETPDTEDTDPADDELGFSFDEDENADDKEGHDPFAGQQAPEWVKQLRKENRDLKKQLKHVAPPQPQVAQLREKPTIADHDFDSDAYEQDLEQWFNEKAQHDEVVKAEQAKIETIDNKYKSSVNAMRAKAKDYDEVEESVIDTLSQEKQALLKMGADDVASLVYALGKSPKKLAELSQLDNIQFIKQVALMENQMATKNRNPNKPQPKQHELTGSAGGGDTKLAKLEAEAERTGNYTKVFAYKKSLKK